MYKTITERKALIKVPKEEKISRGLPVFYNPVMKLNRDISVLILKSISNKNMQIGLPLAGTGVRGIRFLLELPKSKVKDVWFNDHSEKSVSIIKQNLKLNKVKAKVFCKDANLFLIESQGFDYIDVDPFGSPNFLLDSAVKRLGRNGILAVTATDAGCLAGSYPKACLRKYWSMPQRNETMHENGLRILIRKVQLIGAEHDKALIPVFSYFKDHYFRVFFRCEKGKKKVDKIMKMHGMFNDAGPLWLGELWDKRLVNLMWKNRFDEELIEFLKIIKDESKINVIGFYDIHKICKKNKLCVPKKELLKEKIKKKGAEKSKISGTTGSGFKVSETHFTRDGLRSDIDSEKLIKIIKS